MTENTMNIKRGRLAACAALAVAAGSAHAQDSERHFIYAAVPGVGNDVKLGGEGVLVFDADNDYKLVRRIKTWSVYPRESPEPVKGIAAHAGNGLLYVSTTRRLAAIDLATDKLVWEKSYDADCCDRMAVSPDGRTLHVPAYLKPKWYVVDAKTGDQLSTVTTEGEAHNTLYSPSGDRVYLQALRVPQFVVADAKTGAISLRVGAFSDQVRPFTINGKETLAYVNVNHLLGVAVADLKTGKVLHEIRVPGYERGKPRAHGTAAHGIALTHDETEVWVADGPNAFAHIFDATTMPPTYKTSVKLRDEPGWFTCSIDGKTLYASSGDVIDIRSKKIVGTLSDENGKPVESEKLIEINFENAKPVRAGDQFCFGQVR
jgi:DNA-binding beta-propeller fold protein YncE